MREKNQIFVDFCLFNAQKDVEEEQVGPYGPPRPDARPPLGSVLGLGYVSALRQLQGHVVQPAEGFMAFMCIFPSNV
jgi:hypothetical protein